MSLVRGIFREDKPPNLSDETQFNLPSPPPLRIHFGNEGEGLGLEVRDRFSGAESAAAGVPFSQRNFFLTLFPG